MKMLGRCKGCSTVYDINQFEDCPQCGRYSGSQLDSVDLLPKDDAEPPDTTASVVLDSKVSLEVLVEEYKLVHDLIAKMDERALTIKAWSVTTGMAGIGYAIAENHREILLLSAGACLLFWVLEAIWKAFQSVYVSRSREIESSVNSNLATARRLGISAKWTAKWTSSGYRRFLSIMVWPHVYLPHAAVVAVGVALYFFRA